GTSTRDLPVQVAGPADVAEEGGGGDDERAREVDLAGAGTTREIAVDRRDGDLVRPVGDAGAGLDAGTAARIDHLHAGLREEVEVAHHLGVVADRLAAELDVELHAIGERTAAVE